MFLLRIVLSLMLIPTFICPPQAFGQVQTRQKSGVMLYQKVLSIAEKKADMVNRALPAGNVMVVQAEKNMAVKEEIKANMEKLDKASNAEVAEFKKSLLRINEKEL